MVNSIDVSEKPVQVRTVYMFDRLTRLSGYGFSTIV